MAAHQARIQGKSLVQYLRELQTQIAKKKAETAAPRPSGLLTPREKYVYLTRREIDLLFEQISDLRDRALFGTMYYFGLRASEAGLLLQEHISFRTRRIYCFTAIDLRVDKCF
jgi:integrase